MKQSFKQYLESQGKSKSTVTHYSGYAFEFLAWLDKDGTEVEDVTAKEVMGFLAYLRNKGQQNKTRNIRLNVLKHFFNYQLENGLRHDNPIQHIKIRGKKKKKLYPILSKQDLERLYNGYEIPDKNSKLNNRLWYQRSRICKARNKAIISLMINQGLTTAEIDKMMLEDLKLKEGKIYVTGGRKSNDRTLELKSHQIMELMEYSFTTRKQLLEFCKEEVSNLFLSTPPIGKDYNTRTDSKQIWKRLTQELIEQHPNFINFKQVRASVITHWLKQYNLREVQYMAGHRYVSSTEDYQMNQMDDLKKDIDSFHPI